MRIHVLMGVRGCQAAPNLFTEVRTVLANTEAPMCSTRSYSGQHLVQGMVHRRLLIRVERVDGAPPELRTDRAQALFCPYSSVAG